MIFIEETVLAVVPMITKLREGGKGGEAYRLVQFNGHDYRGFQKPVEVRVWNGEVVEVGKKAKLEVQPGAWVDGKGGVHETLDSGRK